MSGAHTRTPATTGLVLREQTIFERGADGRSGFQLPPLDVVFKTPARYARAHPAELPQVGELEVIRHFTRLSSWNYAIDLGPLPLGSCTMKYNPRINEEIAAMEGLADIHPELPESLCQGALEVLYRIEKILCDISGMDECSVQPAAGAHGECTGLMLIRAFQGAHGSRRKFILVPDTAHGTNPASSALAGYEPITLKSSQSGIVSREEVASTIEKYGREIAALMMTNPNTLGIFESNIVEIAELLHGIGAMLYMDGANMNAIIGQAKPARMGVDVMQYNLHKTFSTPHGGGGPGAGPVAVRSHLAPYLPTPRVRMSDGKFYWEDLPDSIGKVKSWYGNFGVCVRALAYILHLGSDGLKSATKAAVLNANYLRAELSKYFEEASSAPSFHECVLTDARQLKTSGVKTLQIAKALIDKGFHPPTIYFPLVCSGAMLIEPTETESLAELDTFIQAMAEISEAIRSGEKFDNAPTKTIVGKVDETLAARRPVLSLDDRSG